MNQNKKLFLWLLIIFVPISYFTQNEIEVSGTVYDDELNETLPGVSILIKNTTDGTTTDFDGKYTIKVKESDTLVFSFVGMTTQEFRVGEMTTYDIRLGTGVVMDEFVVTALGVKKEDKALGYAIQEISGEDAKQAGNANAISSLQGKVAGVQIITSSGSPGAAAKIQIRGNSSASGGDPLIVIDGIPVDNSTRGGNVDGVDQSNRAVDINPDDIESVSVLKGAAATAIWGSRAQNGVIIYTTKKGKAGKLSGTASASVGVDMVRNLQKMQDEYGQTPDNFDAWGPKLDGTDYTNSDGSITYSGNKHDNSKDFYDVGIIQDYNFALSGGTDKINTRASVGYFNQSGVIPTSAFERLSIRSNTNAKLTDALDLTVNANLVNSKANRTQRGSNLSGITLTLYRTPANYNVKEAYDNDILNGGNGNVMYHPAYDNPFWSTKNLPYDENVMRFIGATKLSYDFAKRFDMKINSLVLRYELATDLIYENTKNYTLERGSNSGQFTDGYINDFRREIQEFNQNILLNGSKQWTDVSLDFLGGVNLRTNNYNYIGVTAQNFIMDDYYNIANGLASSSLQETEKIYNPAFLFDLSVGYKSMLYLNVNGRNEWSSALPYNDRNKNGFYYPGISGSFVFTELGDKEYGALSFGKVRLGWGQTGLMPGAYAGQNTFIRTNGIWDPSIGYIPSLDPNNVPLFSTSTTLQDPDLTPERTSEIEAGVDLRFWDGRLNIEATYYDRTTKGGLYFIPTHPSTGYSEMYTNATDIRNYGFELVLSGDAIKNENFNWNIMLNTTVNRNFVKKINSDIKEFGELGFSNSVQNFLVEGQPFLVMYGSTWLKDNNGNIVFEDYGPGFGYLPVIDGSAKKKIGDPNPTILFGLNNTFTFNKNFTIALLTDIRIGGDVWNGTYGRMTQLGTAEITEDREGTITMSGVDENGNPRDFEIEKELYYRYVLGGGADEMQIEKDINWFKVRQLSFSYTQNLKGDNKVIKGITYTLAGSNLFTWTNYSSGDPETALGTISGAGGNSLGLDYFNNPNTRQILAGIKINF